MKTVAECGTIGKCCANCDSHWPPFAVPLVFFVRDSGKGVLWDSSSVYFFSPEMLPARSKKEVNNEHELNRR